LRRFPSGVFLSSPETLCPWLGGVLEFSGVFDGRLSLARSLALSARSASTSLVKRSIASTCERMWTARKEAKLIALTCSEPPKGRAVVGEQGRGTEHRRSRQRQHDRADAQKNILKPHLKQQWVIPPEANSAFVAAMEDGLAVYTRAHDPDCPVVCLDETSKQLVAETRVPVPMKPGQPARSDYE
jgi:hypothetical protein